MPRFQVYQLAVSIAPPNWQLPEPFFAIVTRYKIHKTYGAMSDSIFDSIRINKGGKKRKPGTPKEATTERVCEWEGCNKPGTHKAPKGRDREGEFRYFCVDHVREYNKNYNYFSGMDDDSVASYQKNSHVGHRPTWKMGVNSWGNKTEEAAQPRQTTPPPRHESGGAFNFSPGSGGPRASRSGRTSTEPRKVKRLEQQSFDKLGLPSNADSKTIKSKYKQLVKQNHPDVNGGDRSSEDRLREIIQAYNFLKSAGYTD